MDLVNDIHKAVRNQRMTEFKETDQLALGEFIEQLEKAIESASDREDKEDGMPLCFDFGGLVPDDIDSWRGSYAELAISYKELDFPNYVQAKDFLQKLKDTVGKTLGGYKGGDFRMDSGTPVWVSNYGQADCTAVLGVEYDGYFNIYVITGRREY